MLITCTLELLVRNHDMTSIRDLDPAPPTPPKDIEMLFHEVDRGRNIPTTPERFDGFLFNHVPKTISITEARSK